MTIMVTGGAGYIGSHTCAELIQHGHNVLIYDNLCNSNYQVLHRIKRITGVMPAFVNGDVRNYSTLVEALTAHRCEAVIHFAGLKSVSESFNRPDIYYDNNVVGSLTLFKAMQQVNVRKIVFSSSATVYGEPHSLPLEEDHPLAPFSPYGRTKKVVEDILADVAGSARPLKVAILRYFNPVGAHESGLMGEAPNGIPNNLMPFISEVAVGRRRFVNVFGNDYDTPDGTGIRDYVHVMDLATGHLRALESFKNNDFIKVNLGTGCGSSVLELIAAFEKASDRHIPVEFAPRRAGDIAEYYASSKLAGKLLGWQAKRSLEDMCRDVWNWQSKNPAGYLGSF
jgi:UDP-glucose 4-epimerase